MTMGLWSKRTPAEPQSGQQRRAKAVREADRAGHAAINASTRRRTAVENDPPRRSWWR
jgi:hypothetical protein